MLDHLSFAETSNYDHHAKSVVAGILSHDQTRHAWNTHYITERANNPADAILSDLAGLEGELENNPALVRFMIEMIEIEHAAMVRGLQKEIPDQANPIKKMRLSLRNIFKRKADPELAALTLQLDNLKEYLYQRVPPDDLPDAKNLSEAQKNFLDVVRFQVGHNKFRPVKTLLGMGKEILHHFKEEFKRQPFVFSSLIIGAASLMHFMNARIGGAKTTYIDPELASMEAMNMDEFFDSDTGLTFDPNFDPTTFQPSCHDHLKQIFGEKIADFITQSEVVAKIFPEHCMKISNFVPNAQDWLQGTYDTVNSRLYGFTDGAASSLSEYMSPDSEFRQAFDQAAMFMAENIKMYDMYENLTFHFALTIFGTAIGWKFKNIKNEEVVEAVEKIKNFGNSSLKTLPLTYVFGLAGALHGYMMNSGFDPDMVIHGGIGIAAGSLVHRFMTRLKRTDFVKNTTLSVKKSLAVFSDRDKILNGGKAHEDPSVWKRMWGFVSNKTTVALASIFTAAVAADMNYNNGMFTGYLLGGAVVTGTYASYNIPEEVAAHLIFGITGGLLGYGAATAVDGAKAAKRKIKATFASPRVEI